MRIGRRLRRSTGRRLSLALVVAFLAVACSGGGGAEDNASSASETGQPKTGGDLTMARPADNTSLDPTVPGDNETIWTVEQMFETLYTVTPDGKDVQPWLAESYDVSDDQMEYTFHLREGIRFSNGDPVTGEDAAFSIKRAASSGTGLTYIDAAIDKVTAPDDSTVVVTTKYPWAPLVADIALYVNGVIPADFGGVPEKQFWEDPVGTGPFMLGEWKRGQSITLERNPNYWQEGKPYLDSVTFTNAPNDNSRVLQIKGGQADIVRFPPYSAIADLESTPGIQVELFPSTRVDYILMNQKVEPFDDVHVRRAIAYAIDRQALVDAILFGNGQPADSILGPTEPFYDPNVSTVLSYDLDAAKQEMAQSSVPKGFDAEYLTTPDDKVAEALQQQLEAIGINLTIRTVDVNQIFQVQGKGDYEITPEYWTEDIPDPDERISWFLDPEAGGNSYFTYNDDPEIVDLVNQAQKEFDQDTRGNLYSQIQERFWETVPQIPLYYSPYAYAATDAVHGFQVYPLGNFHMEDVWLSE
jgi:peptide/nickel transport system substrate-binding protein